MKKLMLMALSMALSGVVFAHGGGLSDRQNQENSDLWQGMQEIHDVMHNTSISTKPSENGITFEITANSDSTIKSINKRFVDEQTKLETYLKGVSVTVHSLDNGVEVVLESSDKKIVDKLNVSGRNIVYEYLHEGTAGFSAFRGHHRGGYGPGMMHGWSNRNGMGPGMMYDNGSTPSKERGNYQMGPGMMYENGSTPRSEKGRYQRNDYHMGNDSGMM